jgi:predicted DNA-binding transcriptional regulator AlpA
MPESTTTPKRYINKRELLRKLGLSYPSIWKRMAKGEFPAPIVIGIKNFWIEEEVDRYVASHPRSNYYPSQKMTNAPSASPASRFSKRVRR